MSKNDELEKLEYKNYINSLFDIYGSLLTSKQQEYFKSYYFLDFSLREIASTFEVSSNAIYDQLKNIEKILLKYEENLNIYHNEMSLYDLFEKIDNVNNNSSSDKQKLEEINKLIAEIKKISIEDME